MTALAGTAALTGNIADGAIIQAMLAAQQRYAVSPPVIVGSGPAAFGRALYPLLAEDAFDTGPQHSADGQVLCVADVRLDNRADLIAALDIGSTAAASLCDAALVLAAWLAWDTAVFDRLRGDFAVAIHDRRQQRLILARDFLGQRPLFYHQAPDMLAFASMPSGLLALPSLAPLADKLTLTDYLASRRSRHRRSFFAGVTPVPPGHWLTYESGTVALHRYWQPPVTASAPGDKASRTAIARRLFDTAVAHRLRDTAIVASHLSGGIDSGAVTLSAARHLPGERKLLAYTAVPPPGLNVADPPGRFVDEGPLAGLSASRAANIVHRCIWADRADFSNRWEHGMGLFQQPLPGVSNYRWTAAIYDHAKAAGAATLLIGQVGNLSISYQLPGDAKVAAVAGPFWRRFLRPIARRARTWQRSIGAARQRLHFLRDTGTPPVEPPLPPDAHDERVAALQLLDFGSNGKAVLAGWGLDLRDPTADRDLIDFCLSLPLEDFVEDGRHRGLARRALTDLLPAEVLFDQRRGLQSADWRAAMLLDRPALLAEVNRAREHPLASAMIDLDGLEAALLAMGDNIALAQADQQLLRQGALRALAASHFMRVAYDGETDTIPGTLAHPTG